VVVEVMHHVGLVLDLVGLVLEVVGLALDLVGRVVVLDHVDALVDVTIRTTRSHCHLLTRQTLTLTVKK
jgi:hypothetical protein